jgi:hypothetical protein
LREAVVDHTPELPGLGQTVNLLILNREPPPLATNIQSVW